MPQVGLEPWTIDTHKWSYRNELRSQMAKPEVRRQDASWRNTVHAVLRWSWKRPTVQAFNFCTKCVGSPCIIHDRMPGCQPAHWTWTCGWPHNWTKLWFAGSVCHLYVWLISLTFSIGICTTRHWQTSGRLVQELNPCTVVIKNECRRSLFFDMLSMDVCTTWGTGRRPVDWCRI